MGALFYNFSHIPNSIKLRGKKEGFDPITREFKQDKKTIHAYSIFQNISLNIIARAYWSSYRRLKEVGLDIIQPINRSISLYNT